MNDKDLVLNDGSTPLTATGNGTSFDIGSTINALTVEVIVSAKSGTSPTLDLKIQGSLDNSTWVDVVYFQQITAVGTYRRKLHAPYRYFREVQTLGGTSPSFTTKAYFTVGGRDTKFG